MSECANVKSLKYGHRQLKALNRQTAIITNRRYTKNNQDVVWSRPKGLLYGNMPGSGPDQKANLYPDESATYFVANICLPEGSHLILKGQYPHARYISFTVANQLGDGQLGNGNFLRGNQINPDPGSRNPFLSKNRRDVLNRNFTLYVVRGLLPSHPADNTLYTGKDEVDQRIHLAIRTYLVDKGYDGTGNVKLKENENENENENECAQGLPEVLLGKENGETISGPELVKLLKAEKNGDPPGYQVDHWLADINACDDKTNAPCLPNPAAQVFWNTDYSVTGAFEATKPKQRVIDHPPSTAGGFATNPDTSYMVIPFSFGFGEVVVVKAKKPTHPYTREGNTRFPIDPQVQYFSISVAAGPGSGQTWDTVFDEELPVDEKGYFTAVISWPWNRPSNATYKNGIVYMNPIGGEGHYIGARAWVGVIYIRYQNCSMTWKHSPQNIPMPTVNNPIPQGPFTMEAYYPVATNMSKERFEKEFNQHKES